MNVFAREIAESSTHWIENVQEACETLRDWLADAEPLTRDEIAAHHTLHQGVLLLLMAAQAEYDRR